jgi:hypothetical protein
MSLRNGHVLAPAFAAALLLALAQPSLGRAPKYKSIDVKTPDGLTWSLRTGA